MAGKRFLWIGVFALSLILVLAGSGCSGPSDYQKQLQSTGLAIQKGVQSELDRLDAGLSDAASNLLKTGLSGSGARQILSGLVSDHPFLIDSCVADASGRMVTVAPEAYSRYEGSDLSRRNSTGSPTPITGPLLSPVFSAVEGVDGVVVAWPVSSASGEISGSISALFKPEALFSQVIGQTLKGTGIEVNAIQLDGLNIYDSEGSQSGTKLFTNLAFHSYPQVLELGKQMIARESGTGSYIFTSHTTGKDVKKQAFWLSLKLHDTAWRLMSAHEVAN
jgi:hypothetical protein